MTESTAKDILEAVSTVAAASVVMMTANRSDGVTFEQNGDELTVIAPMGMKWANDDHGLTVDVSDAAAVWEAVAVLDKGTSECDESDGCDVCDYGAKEAPETFAVWVSTFGLYNEGYLIGEWVEAAEAPETIEAFAALCAERGRPLPVEALRVIGKELWCFDTENAPIRGEMSPSDARAIAEAIEGADIGGDELPAFLAVARNEHASTAADIERIAREWCDTFAGYQTAEDYAAELVDGMGDALPEWCAPYFDMEAFARDLQLGGDITELQTAEGVTFVIRNY